MPVSEAAAEKVLTPMSFDGLEMNMGASLADLLKQGGPDTAQKREDFMADVAVLRGRLKARNGFINPRRTYVQYWDMTTGLALVFTAIVTPFEVCVGLETRIDTLYFFNSVVNLIFLVDIVVQFFLPVVDKETKELIRDHRELARRYLAFWFWIDVLSILPFDTLTLVAPGLLGAGCGGSATLVRGVKLVRALRLFKLLRMLRSSRIVQRWDSAISVSTSTRTMIFAWTTWAVAMHWLACCWLLLPQLQDSFRDEPALEAAVLARLARNDSTSVGCEACLCSADPDAAVCRNPCLTPCEIEEVAASLGWSLASVREGQDWLCRAANRGWLEPSFYDNPGLMWAFALAKVLGGLGPLAAVTAVEAVVFSATGLAVRISFAVLQGLILRVLTTGDPDETKFRQRLDALNYMMRDQGVPQSLRLRVRTYVTKTKQLVKRANYFGLIDSSLSKQLRKEMRGALSTGVFAPVWWLQGCEPAFLQELSNYTEREAYAEGELIPHVMQRTGKDGKEFDEWRLCLLISGVANRAGSIITSGAYWGDVILANPMLRDSRAATAMSFCEVCTLARAGLDALGSRYPASASTIRQAALKLATKRTIMITAMYYQTHASELPSLQSGPGGSIQMSKALKAMTDTRLLDNPETRAGGWREPDEVSPAGAPASRPTSPAMATRQPQTPPPPAAPKAQVRDGVTPAPSSDSLAPSSAAGATKKKATRSSGTPSGAQAFSQLVEKLDSLETSQGQLQAQMREVLTLLRDQRGEAGWNHPLAA